MALSKPEWQIAQLAMTLALNTTMRACEIRGLCWKDIDFIERVLCAKAGNAGLRLLPLNDEALDDHAAPRKK